jgi:hypothetical protein
MVFEVKSPSTVMGFLLSGPALPCWQLRQVLEPLALLG